MRGKFLPHLTCIFVLVIFHFPCKTYGGRGKDSTRNDYFPEIVEIARGGYFRENREQDHDRNVKYIR